jgi:eukaryotic-like serine/threonine-protein kinase
MSGSSELGAEIQIGRYTIHARIASGGMASVHFGRLSGAAGFARTVAIKRLHAQFADDPAFTATLLREAQIVTRIRHFHVVPVLDVVSENGVTIVVMEYIHGVALSKLVESCARTARRLPIPVAVAIAADVLTGLQAVHDATSSDGRPLGLVHRDVSPHNILVGSEGIALITDFGIAKAAGESRVTKTGQVKGKLAYMAPEQLSGEEATQQSDLYAAAVVIWEMLAGARLFSGSEAEIYTKVMQHRVPTLADLAPDVSPELERILRRGLAREPSERYASAREMAADLTGLAAAAPREEVASWVRALAGDVLAERAAKLAELEEPLQASLPVAIGEAARAPERSTLAAPIIEQGGSAHEPERGLRARPVWVFAVALAIGAAAAWIASTRSRGGAEAEPGRGEASTSAEATSSATSSSRATAAPVESSRAPPSVEAPPATSASSEEAAGRGAASTRRTAVPPPPNPRPKPATSATAPCRKLGADGIWTIERCPVK